MRFWSTDARPPRSGSVFRRSHLWSRELADDWTCGAVYAFTV